MTRRVSATLVCLWAIVLVAECTAALAAASARLPEARPEEAGMNSRRLAEIDTAVAERLKEKGMPGCVVMVCRQGKTVFLKAYGDKQVSPTRVPMTTDTLFDMASLTKPVATATSVMILVERGKLHLDRAAAQTIAEFAQNGKDKISVLQLLTHQGGLIADNPLSDYADGPAKAWERIMALRPRVSPGSKFIYTDVGFLVLGELVRRASGKDVHEFSRDNIFKPLGMTETGYLPGDPLRKRAAPTERRKDQWMQGEVHDPRAYELGGVAGHAGLFSTAADLAVYAQMMLGGGEYQGVRILSRESVAKMTSPYPVSTGLRGLGWDVQTKSSSNRSPAYSPRAFGHGGFTGTSMWIDPQRELTVIFLSNRVHPDGKGAVNPLAARIGTIAVEAIEGAAAKPAGAARSPKVLTGIDVLQRDKFARLAGRRVGLITNQSGVNGRGVTTLQVLREAPGVKLVAIFSPEHGLQGKVEAHVADSRDPASGLPIYSLYGKTRTPTAESLRGIDTLVFDIQDIGTRFYTFISTMGNCMKSAAEHKLRFVVLDRPNPINGRDVAGPVLDAGRESFVAFFRLPIRHGMTVGELARMFNGELRLGLDLDVIRVEGWQRGDFFDATGLPWVNPSPNIRNLTEAILYPGIGILETTNLSMGRGTATPFEIIGAPWLDGPRLARAMTEANLPGVRFEAVEFTPEASKFQGQRCGGIRVAIADRNSFEPIRTGLEIAHQLRKLYPETWNAKAYDHLLGNRQVLDAVLAGKTFAQIEALYRPGLQDFLRIRAKYLLYEP